MGGECLEEKKRWHSVRRQADAQDRNKFFSKKEQTWQAISSIGGTDTGTENSVAIGSVSHRLL